MSGNAIAGPSRNHFSPFQGMLASPSPINSSTDNSPSNRRAQSADQRGSNSPAPSAGQRNGLEAETGQEGSEEYKHRQRFKRSTRGCLTCRAQKVKCDEVHPTCNKCGIGQRECEWPSAEKLARPRKRRRKLGSLRIPHLEQEPPSIHPYDFRPDLTPMSNYSLRTISPISTPGHSPKLPAMGGNALEHSLLAHRRKFRSGLSGGIVGVGGVGAGMGRSGTDFGDAASIRSFEEVKLTHGINVEALANAAENDPYLVEQGPFTHQPITAPASLAALTSAFPSPGSLQLFHHFFNYTTRILITMGDIGPNPHLSLCTPARLLDTGSAASAALRMSMLSTSTAHLIHAAEGGPLALEPMRKWGEVKERLLRLGDRFRRAALQNVVLSDNDEKDQFDTILATWVLLMIRDIISAGSSWQENMDYAVQLVFKRGGAAQLISQEPQNFMRRFLIENLLVHNVFSCFVTNKEPALLNKYDRWWFECPEYSKTRWEWESVERTFGISRGMVEIISRVVSLNAQKKRLNIDFTHHHSPNTASVPMTTPHTGRSSTTSTSASSHEPLPHPSSSPSASLPHPYALPNSHADGASTPATSARRTDSSTRQIEQHIGQQAESLLAELEVLGSGLGWVPRNHRVSCGDILYRYMAIVYLLGDILDNPPTHPLITTSISHCLELCSEAGAMRMSVMLIWPLLICGTFCERVVGAKVASLFEAFSWDYIEDLKAARILMDEQWRCIDTGPGRQSWATLMANLGMSVLVI